MGHIGIRCVWLILHKREFLMSRISNSLEQALYELEESTGRKAKPGLIKRMSRTMYYFMTDLYYDYPHHWYYIAKHFCRNVKFFWPHILGMKDFDSSYQIDLFCDSLEYLARGLKRWDNCVGSDRNYKRCMTAAKQLRKAYADEGHNDKSYRYLSKKNPIRFVKLNNGHSQMTHDYSKTEEYYTKMFKVINKRIADNEKKAKLEAWTYIYKYIQHWWE